MLKNILITILVLAAVLAGAVYFFFQRPEFGRLPEGDRLARVQASPHYKNGEFQNLEEVKNVVEGGNRIEAMWEFLFGDKTGLVPAEPLPSHKTDLKMLDPKQDLVVWMGHSSFYMQLNGRRILVDPVFSDYASPLPFINRTFAGSNVYTPDDIPPIDLLIMSHDHWDHLDYPTITALRSKVKEVILPLGVGETFTAWGFDPAQLHEEDWYSEVKLANDFSVYVLPAQHFSGRGLKGNQTLWASFAFITPGRRVFYSGDSGYGQHFKEIGNMFGTFDLALLEDGQYNKDWAKIHMMPEQTAQAAVDVHAKVLLPVHNSKLVMARHAWQDPLNRILKASEGKPYKLLTPEIGEAVMIGDQNQQFSAWWEGVK